MDGIRIQTRIHDENAGAGPVLNNNKPLQQGSTGSLKAGGPLSARKAFGNITNKSSQQSQQKDGSSAGAIKPRRALGELSVNRPSQQQGSSSGSDENGKSSGSISKTKQAFGSAQQQAASTAVVLQRQQQDLAQRYAAGGIERFAGKTWQQMEDERDAEEEAAAAAAARHLTAHLGRWRVGGEMLQIASDDDEDQLLAPERRQQAVVVVKPARGLGRSGSGFFSVAGGCASVGVVELCSVGQSVQQIQLSSHVISPTLPLPTRLLLCS